MNKSINFWGGGILLTPKFFQVILVSDLLNIWRCLIQINRSVFMNVCLCWCGVAVKDGPWPLLQSLICLSSAPRPGWFITGETLQANGLLMKLLEGSGAINPHLYMQVVSDSPIHSAINNLHDTEPQQKP